MGDGSIVLTHWGDGHNHLYLYGYVTADPIHAPTKLERQLTAGDFEVSDIYRLDAAGKLVDFASNEGGEFDQQLWQVNFAGEKKQLSAGAGTHEGTFAPSGNAFVDKQSARMEPTTLKLCAEAAKCSVFWSTKAV